MVGGYYCVKGNEKVSIRRPNLFEVTLNSNVSQCFPPAQNCLAGHQSYIVVKASPPYLTISVSPSWSVHPELCVVVVWEGDQEVGTLVMAEQ